jgi:hypothetical protein
MYNFLGQNTLDQLEARRKSCSLLVFFVSVLKIKSGLYAPASESGFELIMTARGHVLSGSDKVIIHRGKQNVYFLSIPVQLSDNLIIAQSLGRGIGQEVALWQIKKSYPLYS